MLWECLGYAAESPSSLAGMQRRTRCGTMGPNHNRTDSPPQGATGAFAGKGLTAMARIFSSAEELIGHTPLLELTRLERELGLSGRVLLKLEAVNPGGSAKDRPAREMIDDAEARGVLVPDATIIEPTSGNTGIGLAVVAALRGYRAIIVMPDSMSEERRRLMSAHGAELVLTPGAEGMAGAIAKARELAASIPGSFIPGQFENPANAAAHERTTGPEIWEDTDGEVAAFTVGIGTGGTITGVGRYLHGKNPGVRIVGVEPATSPVLSGGQAGPHKLQGIGAGFVPEVLDLHAVDEVLTCEDDDAYAFARLVGKREGVLVGISSGAAVWAACQLAKRPEFAGKIIVALATDGGDHYLSTDLYA